MILAYRGSFGKNHERIGRGGTRQDERGRKKEASSYLLPSRQTRSQESGATPRWKSHREVSSFTAKLSREEAKLVSAFKNRTGKCFRNETRRPTPSPFPAEHRYYRTLRRCYFSSRFRGMEIRVGFQRDAPRFACAELPIARNESVVVRPASREAYQIPSTAGKMNSPIVSFDVPVKKKKEKRKKGILVARFRFVEKNENDFLI